MSHWIDGARVHGTDAYVATPDISFTVTTTSMGEGGSASSPWVHVVDAQGNAMEAVVTWKNPEPGPPPHWHAALHWHRPFALLFGIGRFVHDGETTAVGLIGDGFALHLGPCYLEVSRY